jgi:hypothetical protein
MLSLILECIIIVLVVAFVYWAYDLIITRWPLKSPFGEILSVLVLILCVAIVLFYAIIPIIQAVGHMSFSALGHG